MTQTNGNRKTVAIRRPGRERGAAARSGRHAQTERHAAEGHFEAGSMEPKIAAAMRFVRSGAGA